MSRNKNRLTRLQALAYTGSPRFPKVGQKITWINLRTRNKKYNSNGFRFGNGRVVKVIDDNHIRAKEVFIADPNAGQVFRLTWSARFHAWRSRLGNQLQVIE